MPEDRTIDGRSFVPVLLGEARTVRDWVFTDYRPRFPNIPEVTYIRDRRFKLYGDGRFFDVAEDVGELSPLVVEELSDGGARAHAALSEAMAGVLGD